jgi:dipeptidyl-peptidase-4
MDNLHSEDLSMFYILHPKNLRMKIKITLLIFTLFLSSLSISQIPGGTTHWSEEGNGIYSASAEGITLSNPVSDEESIVINTSLLTPPGEDNPLEVKDFSFSEDRSKVLIYTNSKRVWRYETRGDYWLLDMNTQVLQKLGKPMPASSLMFAKLSADGSQVAYVHNHNIYLEEISTGEIKQLTTSNGTPKLINGTFDWAYEEEFSCLDGFRWSPDGQFIAFWQIDANDIKDFYMINNTDSIYPYNIPVEYPKVGEDPSSCRIGVINVADQSIKWMDVPGDTRQNYIPRMEWAANSSEIMIQQLNRKQNESRLFLADAKSGSSKLLFMEKDDAWISVRSKWPNGNGWRWIDDGSAFLWITESDGWRHVYRITRDGNKTLVTNGNYDIINPLRVVEETGDVYFTASPDNATEKYLYHVNYKDGKQAKRLTPENQEGTHNYTISPNGKIAVHRFSNYFSWPMREWVSLPDHKSIDADGGIVAKYNPDRKDQSNISFFTVTTDDGIEMDGWMALPSDFDPNLKYPTVFNVYSEPAAQTVINRFGIGRNLLYNGDMAKDGYIYLSVDGRGTPGPKGRGWRKSIYRKIGIVNIRDQAMACKKLMETHSYIDETRIAVHGWSGGGSATLNLLFQYPDLYQTGIAVAAVANQLTYDNIYQERYMGVPWENKEDFINGSPITYAKNLKGNLLYIHGTGDDNVHYQNAELLINELIKHNKIFQVMPYPNRAHGIFEGQGTRKHLNNLFTTYLKEHCPPGPRKP